MSIIGSRHPRTLFKGLKGTVVEQERGIYELKGYPLPVQVIEGKKLETAENLWLRGLEGGLNTEILGAILEKSGTMDRAQMGAYLHAVLEANSKTVEEVTEMKKKKLTLNEVLEKSGMTAEWEKRGKRTAWEEAISLLKQGYTVEQLEKIDPATTPLPTNP
jgi:hypothetical protein